MSMNPARIAGAKLIKRDSAESATRKLKTRRKISTWSCMCRMMSKKLKYLIYSASKARWGSQILRKWKLMMRTWIKNDWQQVCCSVQQRHKQGFREVEISQILHDAYLRFLLQRSWNKWIRTKSQHNKKHGNRFNDDIWCEILKSPKVFIELTWTYWNISDNWSRESDYVNRNLIIC